MNSYQASASSVSNVDERIRMKSYNHLFEEFNSKENARKAIHTSSKGKRMRRDVQRYLDAGPDVIQNVQAYARSFKNKPHEPVEIYDGIKRKKRKIIVPRYSEQIIHHMAVAVLQPIFERGMYEHSYASIPGRGAHKGKKHIEKWIRHDPKNCKYILKMDIHKFFDSIPHDILLKKLKAIIHDERFFLVLKEIISVTDEGLPLGFYTSQWLANWYLQSLDHYIKEELRAAHYVRYMDDMVVFGSNKRKLHKIRKNIDDYLRQELGLRLKENWQVYRFDYTDQNGRQRGRDLDYMGFRFYRNRTTIRRSIMLKATRKAKRVAAKSKPTIYDIRQTLSYMGWISCTDTYQMFKERIAPHVNVKKFKRRVSQYDRRKGEKNGMV